ncbi:MAG: hypothetical protein OXE40_13595, partial [Gammaproteobacteria bacterium]|nr:hypothetical protein [Gammaproteobacteria bacterium]
RRRVIRQDRSASGGPAQQVDTVAAVAFPACPVSCNNGPIRESRQVAFRILAVLLTSPSKDFEK